MIKTPEDFANALSALMQPVPYSQYADFMIGEARNTVAISERSWDDRLAGSLGVEIVDFAQARPVDEARLGMSLSKSTLLKIIMKYFKETQPDDAHTAGHIIDAIQHSCSQALTATVFDESSGRKINDVRHRTCLSGAEILRDIAIQFGATSATGQKAIHTLLDLGQETITAKTAGYRWIPLPSLVQAGYLNALSTIADRSMAAALQVTQIAAEKDAVIDKEKPSFHKTIGIEMYGLYQKHQAAKKEGKISKIFSNPDEKKRFGVHVNSLLKSIFGVSVVNYIVTTAARIMITERITDAAIILDNFLDFANGSKFADGSQDQKRTKLLMNRLKHEISQYNQETVLSIAHPGLVRAKPVIDTRLRQMNAGVGKMEPQG